MAERIPQSVAKLVVFRAYLAADGTTPATGKTIAITISKNGATSFSNPNAGATNAVEMASGFYKFTLDTTDTGTLGPIAWRGAQGDIHDPGDVYEVETARASQTSVDDLPTNAELATSQASADDATLAAIAGLNNLSQADIRTAVGLGSANLDTQLDAIPTNADLATSQAAADDATLAAIAALNNVSTAQVQTAAAAALTAYDPPTRAEATSDKAEILAVVATVDTVVDAIKVTTDKLDDTLEDDAGTYRFTANALEEAPSGGGGTAPTVGEIADEVQTRTIAAVTMVNGLAANTVTASALATDAVTEIQNGLATAANLTLVKAKTDLIPASPAAVGSAMTLASGALTAAAVSADAANKMADHTRRRQQANVEASSNGDALDLDSEYGFIQMGQDGIVAANILTVYRTNGSTVLGTKTLTTDAAAEPVIGVS